MSNLIIFSTLCLILFIMFLISFKSFKSQYSIRRLLKQGMRSNKKELRQAKGNPVQLEEAYKRVSNYAVFSGKNYRTMRKRHKFEQKVNSELNRMIKNPLSALFACLLSTMKGITSMVLLFATILIGSIAVDEFKDSNLTLPTIDTNIQLKLDTDFEERATQFFNDLFNKGPEFEQYDFSKLENTGAEPVTVVRDYPTELTNPEQLGQALAFHMGNFEKEFTLHYKGSFQDFEQTFQKAFAWLEQNEVYLSRVRRDAEFRYSKYGNSVVVEVTTDYELTAAQDAYVNGKVKKIVEGIPKDLSDVDKVRYVNDYIVTQTKYNLDSVESPYTPYSILMKGEGVCEGYALTALLMLQELGIDVKYVTGEAVPGGPHAWNLVKVDGQWYHLDVTWNDPLPDQGKNVRYDYFLLSDQQISQDHYWNQSDYPSTAESNFL